MSHQAQVIDVYPCPDTETESLTDSQATGPIFGSPLPNVYVRSIDPKFVTTDRCENIVNTFWAPPRRRSLRILLLVTQAHPEPLTLGEVLADTRAKIDLPVSDLCHLFGVGRRQFYNLLEDRTLTTRPREECARALHRIVLKIDRLTDGDRAKVRAAMLLPLEPDGETLYSAGRTQDLLKVRRVGDELIKRLQSGHVRGMVPRPSPSLSRFSDGSHAADFLGGRSSEAETDP